MSFDNSIPIANLPPMSRSELVYTMGSGDPIIFHQNGHHLDLELKDFRAELCGDKLHVLGKIFSFLLKFIFILQARARKLL
jgi:hypothetical protein